MPSFSFIISTLLINQHFQALQAIYIYCILISNTLLIDILFSAHIFPYQKNVFCCIFATKDILLTKRGVAFLQHRCKNATPEIFLKIFRIFLNTFYVYAQRSKHPSPSSLRRLLHFYILHRPHLYIHIQFLLQYPLDFYCF